MSFIPKRAFFMDIWHRCMDAGYSTDEARTMAQLEMEAEIERERSMGKPAPAIPLPPPKDASLPKRIFHPIE